MLFSRRNILKSVLSSFLLSLFRLKKSQSLPAFSMVQVNGPPMLPAGVTLQAIDGETMLTSTTMSNNYFTRNGFTSASAWDNPSFFNLGLDDCGMLSSSTGESTTIATMDACNLNYITRLQSGANTDISQFTGTSITWSSQANNGTPDWGSAETGYAAFQTDEPSTTSQFTDNFTEIASSLQDTRPFGVNFTINLLVFGFSSLSIQQVEALTGDSPQSGKPRHIDIISLDSYWFNGCQDSNFQTYYAPGMYGNSPPQTGFTPGWGGSMTQALIARAALYGDVIDSIRTGGNGLSYTWGNSQGGPSPIPIFTYIENGYAYTDATARYITPPELNAATWMAIIHGCRGIWYFNHTAGGSFDTDNDINYSYYSETWSGQTQSIYSQTGLTCGMVLSLAAVINSPTALGYVTVSPPAALFGGFDVLAKWYNQRDFYLFVGYRGYETDTNISATFTVVDTGQTIVTVISADGYTSSGETINLSAPSGGKRTFSDTFANGNTVKIYKIGL